MNYHYNKVGIAIASIIILLTACGKTKQNADCPPSQAIKISGLIVAHSMKGWELYSWQNTQKDCDEWNYAIVPGTNRLKSYSEVTHDSVLLKAVGITELKQLLSKFPNQESIGWHGENWLRSIWGVSNYGNLQLPSGSIQNQVQQYCTQIGLQLDIVP
jgi:hypothetical protein